MLQGKPGFLGKVLIEEPHRMTEQEELDERTAQLVLNLQNKFIPQWEIAEMLSRSTGRQITRGQVKYVCDTNYTNVKNGMELSSSRNCQRMIFAMMQLLQETIEEKDVCTDQQLKLNFLSEIRRQIEALFKLTGSPSPTGESGNNANAELFAGMLQQFIGNGSTPSPSQATGSTIETESP